MYIKGAMEKLDNIAREFMLNGFEYKDIPNVIDKTFSFTVNESMRKLYLEDKLYEKIEKYSKYVSVENSKTGETYYYMTIKELSEDTGLTVQTIYGSVYGGHLANSLYCVEVKYFKPSEICKNKKYMFSRKIGKVKTREYHTKSGKHLTSKVKVLDTQTGLSTEYSSGRSFCNKFKMPTYNLAKYINDGYRFKGRYLIERVD